jgi:hypothetical protein
MKEKRSRQLSISGGWYRRVSAETRRGFVKGSISVPKGSKTSIQGQPCPLVSVSYSCRGPFHGGNTGSNPVGDANIVSMRCARFRLAPSTPLPLNVYAAVL